MYFTVSISFHLPTSNESGFHFPSCLNVYFVFWKIVTLITMGKNLVVWITLSQYLDECLSMCFLAICTFLEKYPLISIYFASMRINSISLIFDCFHLIIFYSHINYLFLSIDFRFCSFLFCQGLQGVLLRCLFDSSGFAK